MSGSIINIFSIKLKLFYMYAVINSARGDKNFLKAQGLRSVLLPFITQKAEKDFDLAIQDKFISSFSDRLEKRLKLIEIILSILSLFVLLLAVAEVT